MSKKCQVQVCAQGDIKDEPKLRPDSLWSWLVCASGLTSVVIAAGVGYSFSLLLPTLMEHFQATRQEIAWIGTLYFGFGCFLSPVGSYASDRFGHRFTAMLASSAGMIGFFLASFSSQLWMMYITYGCLSGFGHVLIVNSSYLVILPHFAKWRSLAVGIVASGPAIGMFLITQLTQVMLIEIGWQWAVRGFAVMYFICGVCATVYGSLENPTEETINSKSIGEERSILSLFRNRSFVILLTSLTVVHLGYYVPTVHIIKHCAQELHIPGSKSSMLFIYFAIASFFSRHLFCKLGDFRCFNRFHLYQGGMTISGLCVLSLPLAKSFSSLLIIFLVNGLVDGSMHGQFSLLLLECTGRQQVNQALGYTMLFVGLTIIIGPSLAGLMADQLGSYDPSFYTTGVVLISGASITSLIAFLKQQPEEKKQSYDDEEILVTEKVTVL